MRWLKHHILPLFLALALTVFTNPLPFVHKLNFFVPCLIIAIYKRRFLSVLWLAFWMGALQDLLSTGNSLGAHTLVFLLSAAICCQLKRFVFHAKAASYVTMGFLLSFTDTLLLYLLFGSKTFSNTSLQWLGTDLAFFPLLEGVLCLVFYFIPLYIHTWVKPFTKRQHRQPSQFIKKRPQ